MKLIVYSKLNMTQFGKISLSTDSMHFPERPPWRSNADRNRSKSKFSSSWLRQHISTLHFPTPSNVSMQYSSHSHNLTTISNISLLLLVSNRESIAISFGSNFRHLTLKFDATRLRTLRFGPNRMIGSDLTFFAKFANLLMISRSLRKFLS